MAYKTSALRKTAIDRVGICDGLEHLNNQDYKNENEFTEYLVPRLSEVIKGMYGLEMTGYKKEVTFLASRNGTQFGIRPDIEVATQTDKNILIECKNLKLRNKKTSFEAITQMMQYKFFFDLGHNKEEYKLILATNYFDFELMQFMSYFGLYFIDVIICSKTQIGFWINEIRQIQRNG